MKKNYLLLLLLVFSMQYISAQITTETFEGIAPTTGPTHSFTSGTATFNLTSTYTTFPVVNLPGTGYASSNRYIQVGDDVAQASMGQSGFIKIASGTFRVSNLWIYLSGNSNLDAGVTFNGQPGSVTFIGKLGGVTQFTVVKNTSGADNGYAAPGNGFTQANFATLGGIDNTNVMIDELEIKLSANYDYFAIDDFAFEAQASAPTVTTTTTTAANIGAVRATLGGTVTAGAPLTAKGIVWSTAAATTTPTLSNNVVTNASTANGAYSDFASGLTPSTLIYYRAYATNNVGTSYGAVLSFTTNAALAATQSQTDVTCNGGSNGTGTVVPSGGKTPYTYSWSPSGGTAATASGLGAGQYNVTITDGDLTTLVKTFDITQPPAATISFTANPPNRTICLGSNTTFPATAVNATAYQWEVNTGSGFSTITNGGVYSNATTSSLTVTGATAVMNGYTYRLRASSVCTPGGVTSNASTLSVSNMTVTTLTKANVQCFGDNNGSASLSTSGGIGPYSYSWAPSGGTNSSASGLAPGTYTITVTDNIGCTKTHQVVINGPTVAFTATPSTTGVQCFGGSNGTATITAAGGTVGYTYAWSTGAITQSITGRQAGTYSVTVTDDNGCELLVENIVIGQPAAMLDGTPSTVPVSCFGGGNGSATIAPTGGTAGYTYLWSNGATTATASNLQAGTYSVTITDANSCQRTITGIVVGQPLAPLNGTPSVTTVSCNGGSNGTATITPMGGNSGYTYLWSNGGTAQTITGLQAGVYSVTITDSKGCLRTINNIMVSQPSAISPNPTQTNVSCFNGSNGTATVAPTGGAGGYTFLWAHSGSTNPNVSGLIAGTYSVKITDNNGCERDQSFTISEPTAIVLTQGTINNVSCFNGSNGTATVSATGGAGSFTYSWSPTGGTAATASGLTAGTYTVTVTDANACQATESFTISQPAAALTVASRSQDNITCGGTPTGSASVVVTGGTGTYTYSWSPAGGTAATASGLYSGTYTVTITDANSCQTSETFIITEPANPLTASQGAIFNVDCRGNTTGSATVNVVGGDGNYTYSWAPSGGTAATATGLASGTYTVTVTDGASCQTTQTFTITQPLAALSATTASTGVSCFGGSNGTASVAATGGTPNYSYAWAPLGGTSSFISGRPAGDYTCTITDSKGCTITKTITISTPTQLTGTIAKVDVSCNGGTNGSATVTPSGGVGSYTYQWSPTGGNAATASGLTQGTYTVTIQDGNTCGATVSVTIDEPALLTASIAKTDVLCNGGATGTATVTPLGGNGSYTYIWSPSGGTAATATGLAPGTYSCLVTDAKGCFVSESITIAEPAILSATTAQIDATCSTAGQAAVNVSGGVTPYSYLWSNGQTSAIVTGLAAGSHSCTITDANGCTLSKNFTINTTNTLVAATSQTDILCNGTSTGSISVIPSGAPGPFTYVWSPSGGNSDTASNLTAGNYSVIITSVNGCSITKNFTITEPSALAVTPSQVDILCHGVSTGSASVVVTGGAGSYTYAWSPSGGNAATASNLTAGTYTVTITDGNLCQTTQSFTITEPNALVATIVPTDVSCNGGTNGSATVTATGGTGTYSYSWSPTGGNSATASGLNAGTYTVTVTDANSCTTTQSVSIAEPSALVASVGGQTNVTCNGLNNGSATVAVTGGTGTYSYVWSPSGGTAATATGLSPGTYTVTVTDANSCFTTQTFTITEPTVLTASAAGQTDVSCNGGTTGSATVTATGGTGTYTYLWSPSGGTAATASGLSAGTYTVIVTDANGCTKTQSFTITQPTAISFTTTTLPRYDYSQPYSQSISTTGGTGGKTYTVTAGNLPTGFSLSSTGVITGASTQIANSNFTVTATDANSCATTHNFELKLNQIPVTITVNASQSKVYGENDPTLTFTASPNLLNGDSFTGTLERVSGENVGNYSIAQGSLSAGDKYLIIYESANFSITQKPITVTANAKSKTYGDVDPALTYTFTPALVTGDSFTGSLTRLPGENVGTHAINQGTLALSSNYTLTYVGADLTISKKVITVTATAKNKTFGDVDPALTYTFAPALVTGDAFSGNLTRTPNENVGIYTINQGGLTLSNNYTLTYVGANLTITKKTITVTAAAKSKIYGDADPALIYTFSPALIIGDSFSGNLARANGNNVGTFAINQGTLSAGTNYTLNYLGNNFTITAKPITVTANASQSKVYGTADPVLTYSVSPNLVSGDAFTGTLTRAVGENVGTYAINQGSLNAGVNYTITYTANDFTINKANQTIIWNQILSFGCEGETTVILTATSNSGLPVSYTSSNSNLVSILGNSLNLLNYGSVTISANQLGNNNYNPAVVVSQPLVNSQPNLIRKQFENIIFFDNSSKSFSTYTWYKNGVLVPDQTDQYFKENGPLNGTYHAVATKLDGIVVTTCPIVLSPTIEEEYIKIVPNPVKPNASYEILNNVPTARLQNARVEVYSIGGLLLENKTTSQNTVTLKAPTVEGIYIIKMTLANGKYFTKNLLVKN